MFAIASVALLLIADVSVINEDASTQFSAELNASYPTGSSDAASRMGSGSLLSNPNHTESKIAGSHPRRMDLVQGEEFSGVVSEGAAKSLGLSADDRPSVRESMPHGGGETVRDGWTHFNEIDVPTFSTLRDLEQTLPDDPNDSFLDVVSPPTFDQANFSLASAKLAEQETNAPDESFLAVANAPRSTAFSATSDRVSRASLVDRPTSSPGSVIQQVQNQQPAPSAASTEEEGEAQQLGVPPPKETPAFLKKRSILLEPGQYQFEYGLRYSVDNSSYALTGLLQEGTNQVQLVNANQKRQLLSTPLELRIGLMENLQGFATLPLGWSAQSLTAGSSQQASDIFGLGDLGFGVTRVLWAPEKAKTRILGFIQASAPIGDGEISLSQQDRDASLGAGYWTLTAGGNVTESIDPLVLFGSVGYTHTFSTRIQSGNYVDVGNTIFYQVGVGYSINSYVTLSGSFSGASSGRIQVDENLSVGARSEPFSLRLSASVNKPNDGETSKLKTNYEPFLRFGLTSLANDVEFGIRWTY